MVVDGIHDGVDCFISEIGEIKISGITDEQLNVRIETGGTEIFNESYYALKGNVVIHEIGEMLRSHFSLHDPKGMSNNVVSYYQAPLSITVFQASRTQSGGVSMLITAVVAHRYPRQTYFF
mgnify:CR=1 FL=1